MTIMLDHMIVPARDKEQAARFFARIFGLSYEGPVSHFAPVRVNGTLTLDFDTNEACHPQHLAFKVSKQEFDEIFARIKSEGIAYGSGPFSAEDMKIGSNRGENRFYFRDPSEHLLEVVTDA